jgi:methylenetetrahydrofolate reductase (NADPH)
MLNPLFIDVTWGAGGRTSDLTTDLCVNAKKFCHLESQMHLTCTNMPKDLVDRALLDCKENGIRNILALRGGVWWRGGEGEAVRARLFLLSIHFS